MTKHFFLVGDPQTDTLQCTDHSNPIKFQGHISGKTSAFIDSILNAELVEKNAATPTFKRGI